MATGAPNRYEIPAFFALHVWLWTSNPSGLFAPFNPRVSCDPGSTHRHHAGRRWSRRRALTPARPEAGVYVDQPVGLTRTGTVCRSDRRSGGAPCARRRLLVAPDRHPTAARGDPAAAVHSQPFDRVRTGTIVGATTDRRPPAHDRSRRRRRPRRHPARGAAVQRAPRPARGRDRIPGLLLGQVRRRADPVRGRAVHDHRRHGRRHGSCSGRTRSPRPPRRPAPTATSSTCAWSRAGRSRRCSGTCRRPGDADDRPQGQVHARARRGPDPRLHLVGDRQRARSWR